MRKASWVIVVLVGLACSNPPPPPPPPPVQDSAPPPIVCCAPSPKPECCMELGGAEVDGVCPEFTCNIPDPSGAGWKLAADSDGCQRWQVPNGAFACVGPPIVEAGPPCAPVSVASYTPSPMTPPNAPLSACTSLELASFYQACLVGGMSSAACTSFQATDSGCPQCLLSQTDATLGPVIVQSQRTKLNVAGCIAILQNDSGVASCAQKVSTELGCEAYACDAVCPANTDAGALPYEQCIQQAAATGCRKYLDLECDPADAGITRCSAQPLDATTFAALGSVFCGGQ